MMDAKLCVKKKISQCNGTRILPGKCWSTVRGFVNDVLNCLKTLRDPRSNLGPKPFALCQFCSNI